MAIVEWTVFVDEREADVPHMVIVDITKPGDAKMRIPTLEECKRACQILNEEGSNIIRLSCQNDACPDKGGWIERSRKDADKNVYHCQVCSKAMKR